MQFSRTVLRRSIHKEQSFSEPNMTKNRKISIAALATVSAAAIISAAALLGGTMTASAARDISLNGGNFFYTANQAEIGEYEEGDSYFTSFVFADDDSAITYRKDLAYHWFSSVKDEDGNPTPAGQEGWLSTEFSFADVNFETFTIKFQSQQYTQTEDEVTENFVIFVADAEGALHVSIGDPLPEEEADRSAMLEQITSADDNVVDGSAHITLSFTGYEKGVYGVTVSDGSATVNGEFTNIGGTYADYVSSSSSTSVTPLTYSATFGEGQEEPLTVAIYNFNGQSFELVGDTNRQISDDVAPVICLNEDVTTLRFGRSLEIDYTVVDMFATNPRSTVNYYVLENSQQSAGNLNDTTDAGYFKEIKSGDVAPIIKVSGAYLPEGVDDNVTDYTTECLVKVYITVQDATGTNRNTDEVFLEWYVPEEYLCNVTSGGDNYQFIRATDDKQGASYTYTDSIDEVSTAYQALVDDAIEEQEARAGDGNYFYLPSFEGFISDNITGYRDMQFSIYYISGSSGSRTSLDYNELAIELEDDGIYRFAIYATDAAGNEMYYLDEDGDPVTFAASELTDLLSDPAKSDLADYVPVFGFEVNYGGLEVTDPEGQEIGFVGTTYNAPDFEVTGLSSNYNITYTLYKFDRYAYYNSGEGGNTITYSEFLRDAASMLDDADMSKYFELIVPMDELELTDPEYELYHDYEWDPDSLSFIPQDDNAFYLIRMEAVDKTFNTKPMYSTMAISVSAAAEPLYGEDTWVQDNVASIVLFCVAGVAAAGIVVVLLVGRKKKDGSEEQSDK